jgi:corrinoid protein of di/trimethylamine methyltransferase
MERANLLSELAKAVAEGRTEVVQDLARQGLDAGLTPLEMITQAMTPSVQAIGDRFGRGEAWLPELVMAGNAVMAGLKVLEPVMSAEDSDQKTLGTLLIGTVAGDVHTIGKDIISSLCMANGFSVIDLGVDVPSDTIVQKVVELKPDLLGLSSLMTTTMLKQKEVVDMLGKAGVRDHVKVMVGGAPVTTAWAEEIGADGYAADAIGAVQLCRRLVGAPEPR